MTTLIRWRLPGDLRVRPHGKALAATPAAIAVAIAIAIMADLAFRSALLPDYLAFNRQPLWPRILLSIWWAIEAELIYRLALMTAIVALPGVFGRKAGAAWMVFAIVASQLANVGSLALLEPPYGAIRFWLVGCIWGWLYWRHGFLSALAGHGLSHLLLDPLLLALL